VKYKIFISGVQKELAGERRAIKDFIAKDVLLREYFDVFLFEDSPAKSKSAEKSYLGEVCKSDIYIGILGDQYGSGNKSTLSPTEAEFREAKAKHKDILIYIKGESSKDKQRSLGVHKLINEIKDASSGYSYRRFNAIDDLVERVYESLIAVLKDRGDIGRAEFDSRICKGASFLDIDNKKVQWFLRVARDKRKFPLKVGSSTGDVFTHLRLLKDGKLTNAAVLLFGKEPQKFFLQAKIKCIQIPSTQVEKPFDSYHIYEGNLFEQVDKAVDFVLGAIKFAVIQQEHTAQALRPYEIPVFAIQEAIVNALAHRNYNTTSSAQVMVFLDRVEMWNSGSLPANLTISDLKKPHASHSGNQLLAMVMYLADYIQQAGSGTLEMVKQCKAHGLPEPEFVSERNLEFKTIIARDIFTENVLVKLGLNARQMKAVRYVKQNGKITNAQYQKINNVSKPTATRDFAKLVKSGIFFQQGIVGKGTVYVIKSIGS
jgi:ATP-dependent DNA helicase RecG